MPDKPERPQPKTGARAARSDIERIAVCITTVGRHGMLVDAMKACAAATPPAKTLIDLIVVDNDVAGTARSIVEKFAANNPLPVTYAIEPRRGLAEARNRGIQLALERGARWLAFIDDDSQPHPDWLDRLVTALRSEGAKLVGGANIFEAPKAPMTAWQQFICRGLVDGSYRRYCRQRDRMPRDKVTIVTGNWCADLDWIEDKALRFDQRYSATGGEDTAFDRSMRATGAKVLFVPDSIVVETVPVARISLRYQFKRLMMSGITKYNYYRRFRGPAFALARALPQGILALLAGPILFVVSAILTIVYPRLGGLLLVRTTRLVGKAIGAFGGALGLRSELFFANHGYADEADRAATREIHGREKSMVALAALPKIQIVRKIVLAAAVLSFTLMFALTSSAQEAGSPVLQAIRWIGIVAIVICILGRTWCTLYIDGRKIEQLVTVGPYSVCRNPLYSFTILGVAGMGAQHGSLLLGTVFCTFTWLVFLAVVLLEESVLANLHGAMFANYVQSTPRFLPNPRLWRDVFTVTVRPTKVIRTFRDGLFFLIPIPLDAAFERLQSSGTLPVLLRLF